jgi:hypothetical protein
MKRRDFLLSSAAAPLLAALPQELRAHAGPHATTGAWDPGQVRHLLPAASHTDILVKASFARPLAGAPRLTVGSTTVEGGMTDTRGEFWQFRATNLAPGRTYRLKLTGADGKPLCQGWDLATFPAPDSRPDKLRVLFYTCAGGHEGLTFLPAETRNRLLRRGLAFKPDAAVANGDQVYWDLRSPLTAKNQGASPKAKELIGGTFERSNAVLGTDNETLLKRAAGPQIAPVYGTDFRSTPTFFVQDDHDYYDNDDAYDAIVTFPPDFFMRQMARATQSMWYPEFLPDAMRPAGLPGSGVDGRARGISESFGTLRYGKLAEVLLYSVRPTMTLAGPSAVFVEDTVEAWLKDRTAKDDVAHLVHAPSNPAGWTAGKWGEWYPDVLKDGKLTLEVRKPYWQDGWLKQHDRLLAAMSGMKGRIPLSMSGDLHAIGLGSIKRTGTLDLSANPVVSVLTGPVGTRPTGWPSGIRKIGAQPSLHLSMDEAVKPIEQHGFTIADFTPDKVVLRFFKWDVNTQGVEAIDTLEPFHTAELRRPA